MMKAFHGGSAALLRGCVGSKRNSCAAHELGDLFLARLCGFGCRSEYTLDTQRPAERH